LEDGNEWKPLFDEIEIPSQYPILDISGIAAI